MESQIRQTTYARLIPALPDNTMGLGPAKLGLTSIHCFYWFFGPLVNMWWQRCLLRMSALMLDSSVADHHSSRW